jgi:threonyl-tRNA synthetase
MGSCHRFEPSGALHGILRVRNFTQDDAHIFCNEEQIESETIRFCKLLGEVYRDLGFEYFVKFSDRPPMRIGSDSVWDQAEGALKSASKAAGLELILNPGEGAFYGPKLEFVLRDAIGRDWQCGTLQVDFMLPERLGASYALIEHYAGRFPLWLAPTQAVVATIVNDADAYAAEVADKLRAAGLRVEMDLRNEKINYKVREHSMAHVPLILAVGRRDMEGRTVAVRRLGSEKQEVLELGAAVIKLSEETRPPF